MDENTVPISRQDLYEMVWSDPMTRIAERLGVEYRDLRATCKRLGVPSPSSGYWEKIRAGKQMARPELPSFHGPSSSILPLALRTTKPAPHKVVVVEAGSLKRLHPLVETTKRFLSPGGKSHINRGRLRLNRGSEALTCTVSAKQRNRALLVWDSIIKSGEASGLSFTISGERTYVSGHGFEMWTRLFESVKTEPDGRWYVDVPTGNLRFLASGPYCSDCKFGDEPGKPIQEQVGQIISRLLKSLTGAAAKKEKSEQAVAQYRHQEEIRLKALAEQEARRKERLESEQREATLREELQNEALRWEQAMRIRGYVSAVAEANLNAGDRRSSVEQWIAWAHKVANELDPLPARSEEQTGNRQ